MTTSQTRGALFLVLGPIALLVTMLSLAATAQARKALQPEKLKASNTLTGRKFEYQIGGYKIRTEFLAEDKLRWTYLEAPEGLTGKTADRRDVHYGIVLLSWTEKDGTNVIDVFDFQTMTLHANAVMSNGKRFFTKAVLTEVF